MTDIDPAAVVREKQALKDALSYRGLHHDTDFGTRGYGTGHVR